MEIYSVLLCTHAFVCTAASFNSFSNWQNPTPSSEPSLNETSVTNSITLYATPFHRCTLPHTLLLLWAPGSFTHYFVQKLFAELPLPITCHIYCAKA